jgi:CTP synthase (UTP-ammonia lyase)
MQDAEHEETAPEASCLVISKLMCSLVGTTQTITVVPETLSHRAYGTTAVTEQFACNYGLHPAYREPLSAAGLHAWDSTLREKCGSSSYASTASSWPPSFCPSFLQALTGPTL